MKCYTTDLCPLVLSWLIPYRPKWKKSWIPKAQDPGVTRFPEPVVSRQFCPSLKSEYSDDLTKFPIEWHGLQYNFQFILTDKEKTRRSEGKVSVLWKTKRLWRDKASIWVSVWWKTNSQSWGIYKTRIHWVVWGTEGTGGMEHLKIETRLRDERFESVKSEYVI
jgi:hypothetical protein